VIVAPDVDEADGQAREQKVVEWIDREGRTALG
jgi:hypothetical protein